MRLVQSLHTVSERPAKRSTTHGMTLMELMLAVTLLATLLAAVAGLIRSGLRTGVGWGRVVEPYQQMERVFNRLARDIESAQRFFGAPFLGTEDHLELARVDRVTGPDGQPIPEWLRVVYRLETQGTKTQLVREEFLWKTSAQSAEPIRRETLLCVVGGHFAFGMQDAQHQLIWASAWDGHTDGLPRLVKFDGTLPGPPGQAHVTVGRIIRNPAGSLPTPKTP